jgi:hypothetical protein
MIEEPETDGTAWPRWRAEEHDFEDGWADPPGPPGAVTDRDEVEDDVDPDEIVD